MHLHLTTSCGESRARGSRLPRRHLRQRMSLLGSVLVRGKTTRAPTWPEMRPCMAGPRCSSISPRRPRCHSTLWARITALLSPGVCRRHAWLQAARPARFFCWVVPHAHARSLGPAPRAQPRDVLEGGGQLAQLHHPPLGPELRVRACIALSPRPWLPFFTPRSRRSGPACLAAG